MRARACNLSLILAIHALCGAIPAANAHDRVLNANPRFDEGSPKATVPKTYTLEGDARYGAFPEAHSELAGRGVRFLSSGDVVWSPAYNEEPRMRVPAVLMATGLWVAVLTSHSPAAVVT